MPPSEIFGPDGLLARRFKDYEPRPGQMKMAVAVARALSEKRHLAVEAPCGIGKSFAYLAPAIEHAVAEGTKVVVCTANIALQEQLVRKDLPGLKELLPVPFTWALVKGLGNYLCLDRWNETLGEDSLFADEEELELKHRFDDWARTTTTGDHSDLPFSPPDAIWGRANGVTELCNGHHCPRYDACFAMDARRRAASATVVVTNYHLYFAHLALKIATERDVILPPHEALICDEAHEMADVARDFFGRRLGPGFAHLLARGAQRLGLKKTADRVRAEARAFFDQVRGHRASPAYRIRLREGGFADPAPLAAALEDYQRDLKAAGQSAADEEAADKAAKYLGASAAALGNLHAFLALDDPNQVAWIEEETLRTGEASARLMSRRIDVSDVLREHLFGKVESVVMTSATLASSGGSFDFLKRETGGEAAQELVVGSPFDFRTQARLVVPKVAAEVNSPAFAAEISPQINRLIRALGGRTLALFTSYRNMNACADAARETGVEILRQGSAPRSRLLEAFREDRGTALFATTSFWQGIDVPGEALSCLVIDKLPFTTPEDPLIDALTERDPETFQRYQLPRATLALRQGFGRLIRRRDDRGVCVLFDNRVFTRRYGREILAALPEVPVHRDLEAALEFFKDE